MHLRPISSSANSITTFEASMNTKIQEIEKQLIAGIEKLVRNSIVAYRLKFKPKNTGNFDEALYRWLDFTSRYIPPGRRKILASDRFPMRLAEEPETGLHRLEQIFIWGIGDVNPYQSTTLTINNDTSSTKEILRTDGLFADWGIHHLHLPLNPVIPGQQYSPRSDLTLFLKIYSNAVLFIDIKSHSETNLYWQKDLVATYIRCWPDDAEKYRVTQFSSISGTSSNDTAHRKLRSSGINNIIEVNGKYYIGPGGGLTGALTSVHSSRAAIEIRRGTANLARFLASESGPVGSFLKARCVPDPIFDLKINHSGDICIGELKSNEIWGIPRNDPTNALARWHDQILPQWASSTVLRHFQLNPSL
jgi:hypothetical protein